MEVDKKDVVLLISPEFGAIIGQEVDVPGNRNGNMIKLKYPFRLNSTHEGMSVGAIFHSEEWCILDPRNCVEVSVSDGIYDVYKKYVNKIHGVGIILPSHNIIIQ